MPSCFKKGNVQGMKCCLCRYGIPHEPSPKTHLKEDDESDGSDTGDSEEGKSLLLAEVVRKRSLASRYMNGANFRMFSLTKSNTDFRILAGISIDYCVKYTSKPQCIDSEKVLRSALNAVSRSYRSRGLAEAREPELSPEDIGRGRIRSLMYNLGNFCQVAGTMVGYVLVTGNRPFISTHRIVNMNLRSNTPINPITPECIMLMRCASTTP